MTTTYLPSNTADILRDAGLKVVEVPGWKTRGRPPSTGSFNPVGVLNHHTGASALGKTMAWIMDYVKWLFLIGRPSDGLPPPLCQMALGRDGTVYLGAAGRANHAGKARARGTVAAGDGNSMYVGIEWMLSGTEAIPRVMYEAGVLLNKVLITKILHSSVGTVAAHYETSVTGKWDIGDPDGVLHNGKRVLNMAEFRTDVQNRVLASPKPPKKPTRVTQARDLLAAAGKRAKAGSKRAGKIARALKILPKR
jgi:hypothetical protein